MNELLNILQNWTNLGIVGACLVFGYVLKEYVSMDNRHIPLIMALVGIGMGIGFNGFQSFEVTVIAGALSGLASTGLHQVFHQYIKGKDNDIEPYFNAYKQKEDKE